MVKTSVRLLNLGDTVKILEFLDTNERTPYKDLSILMTFYILNKRLHDLLVYGFVELKELEKREWYELTEKGRKVLDLLREFAQTVPEKEKLFQILDQIHTIHILEFLYQGPTHYRDMNAFVPATTLTKRLHALSSLRLIEYHFERSPLKREWYELTDKGRNVVDILREIEPDPD